MITGKRLPSLCGSTNSKRLRPGSTSPRSICFEHEVVFFRRIELRTSRPDQIVGRPADHLLEAGIDEDDAVAIVGDHHALVQRFEKSLDLLRAIPAFRCPREFLCSRLCAACYGI